MGNALRLGISKIGLAWTKRRMKTVIRRNTISVLILGTQTSGKTTIALRLWKFKRSLPDLNYVQTKGFNTYAIKRKNKSTINLYDLGGHSSIQELWDHYYADAHGVIFVVDASDQETLPDAGSVFAKVLNDERIKGKPILLLANKQDLGGASELELDSVLNLQEVVNSARCLTRLDESTATDLKNDKGIFEGFRWLVSHIENHYHELNDRVMHDILEEKNREKARRAAAKEQMDKISSPTKARPSSQKSLTSRKFANEDSSIELKQQSVASPSNEPDSKGTTTKNYLIKSRPSSSSGEPYRHFLAKRDVSTAPVNGRRSLPSIHSHSATGRRGGIPFFSNQRHKDSDKLLVNNLPRRDSAQTEQASSVSPSGASTAAGRLSPEGADSDEGIINPAFDYSTEPTLITNPVAGESVGDVIQIQQLNVDSPEKCRKLIRTESSDTEKAGEILMVTTLVQVHQDQISKDRRGSTTSTHDSVALSISSFRSEDTNNTDIWREDELPSQIRATSPQIHSQQVPPSLASGRGVRFNVATGNAFKVAETPANAKDSRLPISDKEQAGRRYNLRPGKNRTAPLPPGMVISTIESGLKPTTPGMPTTNKNVVTSANTTNNSSHTRGNISNSSGGKARLKKKSLSSSDSLQTNPGSELVREATVNQIEGLRKY